MPKQIDLFLDIPTPEDGTDTVCLQFANNPTLRSNPRESLQRSRSLKFRVFRSVVGVVVVDGDDDDVAVFVSAIIVLKVLSSWM
jgi:hypothetical protein